MSIQAIHRLSDLQPGLHVLDRARRSALAKHALTCGFLCVEIDLADCADKPCLLERFAVALAFPEWFGHNWDALADCLSDLDWLPAAGHVLVIEGIDTLAARAPDTLRSAQNLLAEVSAERSALGLPMWVLWPQPAVA